MRKRFRKKVAVLLAVIITLGAISIAPLTASAVSKTADDAISWCQSKLGQGVEYSIDEYRYQCVDFIQAYYSYLGVSPSWGSGYQYAENTLPAGWTRTYGGKPQKGDILVYTGGYGHVAIYESDYVSYHQNWSGSYVQRVERYYGDSVWVSAEGVTKTYWGCIHPNFASSDTSIPTNPWLSISKDHYDIGETVTFNFGATGATYYIIGINRNGSRIITDTVSSGKSYSFNESGEYTAHVTCCNSYGYSDTNTISFAVISAPPINPWLNVTKEHYSSGEAVTFTFGATYADYYIIGINKDGNRIITETITSGKSFTFNEQGNYSAHVTCCNSFGYSDTNTVSFTVDSALPKNPWLSVSRNCYDCGESVVFSFGATDADYYIIGINKDGSRIITETITSGKSYIFNEEGNYTAHVTCCNAYGYSDTNEVSFAVTSKPPFDPWITTLKKQYLIGEPVTFDFGATNAYYYFIGINKDGARIITESVPSGKSYSFNQPGKYTAYVSCCNTYGYVDSEIVPFVVYSADDVGDTNLDGHITISDVTAIQRHLAELAVFNDEQLALADTNGDGRIDISDATHLQMYLAEYDVVLGKR